MEMMMRGMEYVPRHLRRSEMSEKKVNNSKYMNELDNSEMCIYVGGDRRWVEVGVVRECPLTEGVEFGLFVEGHGVNLCAGKVQCGFGHEFDGVIPLPMVRKGVEGLFAEHVFVLMEGLRDQIAERLLFGVFCVRLRQSGGKGAGGADLYWFRVQPSRKNPVADLIVVRFHIVRELRHWIRRAVVRIKRVGGVTLFLFVFFVLLNQNGVRTR